MASLTRTCTETQPAPYPANDPVNGYRGDLQDERPGPVRLPGRDVHRAHGRPCRPAPPRTRLTPGCPGRGQIRHKLRVPN